MTYAKQLSQKHRSMIEPLQRYLNKYEGASVGDLRKHFKDALQAELDLLTPAVKMMIQEQMYTNIEMDEEQDDGYHIIVYLGAIIAISPFVTYLCYKIQLISLFDY